MMDWSSDITEEYKERFDEGCLCEGVNMYEGKIYSLAYTASAGR